MELQNNSQQSTGNKKQHLLTGAFLLAYGTYFNTLFSGLLVNKYSTLLNIEFYKKLQYQGYSNLLMTINSKET